MNANLSCGSLIRPTRSADQNNLASRGAPRRRSRRCCGLDVALLSLHPCSLTSAPFHTPWWQVCFDRPPKPRSQATVCASSACFSRDDDVVVSDSPTVVRSPLDLHVSSVVVSRQLPSGYPGRSAHPLQGLGDEVEDDGACALRADVRSTHSCDADCVDGEALEAREFRAVRRRDAPRRRE